mgnify:CR=1 FL=1
MKSDHPKVNYGKTGVLIINLGTPDSTSWLDIRKYLKEFLSDRRVIELNPILWQIILNLFILNLRPSKTAEAYKKIWMTKENMSPLRYYTISQTNKLKKKIGSDELIIDYAMRYGDPSIKNKIIDLKDLGCEKLIILPLYPQFSKTTSGSSLKEWKKVTANSRSCPIDCASRHTKRYHIAFRMTPAICERKCHDLVKITASLANSGFLPISAIAPAALPRTPGGYMVRGCF